MPSKKTSHSSENVQGLKGLIETKITRSEAIDMMLDSLRTELEKRLKELHDMREEGLKASVEQCLGWLLEEQDVTASVQRISYWSSSERKLQVTFAVSPKDGGSFAAMVDRYNGIQKEINDCQETLKRVNGKEGKSLLLKQMIAQSAAGRSFLNRMDGMVAELRLALGILSPQPRRLT